MKRIVLTLMTLLFSLTLCFPQDTITLVSGVAIDGKVLEVGPTEVKYKRAANLDGPVYLLPIESVASIRYENGTKDIFEVPAVLISPDLPVSADINTYIKGERDAFNIALILVLGS